MPRTVPETPSAPKSLAPYSPAVEGDSLVFLSGQVGIDPATGNRAPDDVTAQTHQVMKTTVFLADIDDFSAVNEVYGSYLDEPYPARSAVQAGALPGGFLVEIEVVATR
jgi:2-iminobutanoate/2-iminopropanoate deaminase